METGYELVEYTLKNDGQTVLFISKIGDSSFIEKLAKKKAGREDASRILSTISRVASRGTKWALESETIKRIKGVSADDVVVFETRNNVGKPIRIATYLHDNQERTPVFLFPFISHQGADSGIKKSDKEKAVRLAREAKSLMSERDGRNVD